MHDVGQTFYEQFKDQGVTKILTIEASGIAPAIMAALHFQVPCLFAKSKTEYVERWIFSTDIHSFTKIKQVQSLCHKNF